jgi:hypothetical protein
MGIYCKHAVARPNVYKLAHKSRREAKLIAGFEVKLHFLLTLSNISSVNITD